MKILNNASRSWIFIKNLCVSRSWTDLTILEAGLIKLFYGPSESWIDEKAHCHWKWDWWKNHRVSGSRIDMNTVCQIEVQMDWSELSWTFTLYKNSSWLHKFTCKQNAPNFTYYITPESHTMLSVIVQTSCNSPHPIPPHILDKFTSVSTRLHNLQL